MIIAEHSVKLERLPRRGNILDLGCRGFDFARHPKIAKHNVYCVDIDDLDGAYFKIAVSDKDGACGIERTEDPQATHIKPGNDIPMMTIATLTKSLSVDKWDIIKMDIEGQELPVLWQCTHPIAEQISVEFHAHTGRQTKQQIDQLLDHLSQWYHIHNRRWEERHCAGFNYWDILLMAK